MSIKESISYFYSGLLINYLIPVRAGEISKSLILKNKNSVPISKSLPSVFIDKLCDLFPILVVLIMIPLINVTLSKLLIWVISALLAIFLLFWAFFLLIVLKKDKSIEYFGILTKIFPFKYRERINLFFTNFLHGMEIMQGRRTDYLKLYSLTLIAVFLEVLYVYSVFTSFGAEVTYWQILFGYTLMNLTYILPTPPAQLGSNQFMWVVIFSFALQIDKDLTSAAVTFSHLLTSIIIFAAGFISLLVIRLNFSEIVSFSKNTKITQEE